MSARKEIQRCIQHAHDMHVWERIHDDVVGWKSGNLNDHKSKGLASLMAVQLRSPDFLDQVIALLEEVKPSEEGTQA